MVISVNAKFERRVGLFPAGIDEDGVLFCNQNFADWPLAIPEGRFDPATWRRARCCCPYKKKCSASSSVEGHAPEFALNEDIRSSWCAAGSAGEWYQVDLGKAYPVHSIQINFAEVGIPVLDRPKSERSGSFLTNDRYIDSGLDLRCRYVLEGSLDGKAWITIKDASDEDRDLSHPVVILDAPQSYRYIKVTAVELAYDQKFALSGLRVFGLDSDEKPQPVKSGRTVWQDPMTTKLSWDPADGALGYNVRYGSAENKLYSSYLVYDKTKVLMTLMNAGTTYWCCIDSFNESGITAGEVFEMAR